MHWHLNTMGYQCSAIMTLGTAEQNKGKQREELADSETLPPDDASPIAELDTNEFRTYLLEVSVCSREECHNVSGTNDTPLLSKAVDVDPVRVVYLRMDILHAGIHHR